MAKCGGCEGEITAAMVPLSMIGKTGRIQAGVIDWRVSGLPVKSRWYCKTAVEKVTAT